MNPLKTLPRLKPAPRNETQEMMLLLLARAEENDLHLSAADLGRELNVNPTPLLHSLVEQSLIHPDASGRLALTAQGRERALSLLRRHRLTERLFTDVLGLDWVRAHEEADKFEHVISPQVEAQLTEVLGKPETCPHGNPIPGATAESPDTASVTLATCSSSTCVKIARIASETPAALQHLATLGLLPNVSIEVENRAPFDGPVMIRVGRAHYALGHDLAARIWVKVI